MYKIFIINVFFWGSLSLQAQPDSRLSRGPWRAELTRKDGNRIVFNFDVMDSAGRKIIYIRNATERLRVDDIKSEGDSLVITLPFFESQLRAVLTGDSLLSGFWVKRLTASDQVMDFRAHHNQAARFVPSATHTLADVTGRWAVTFTNPRNDSKELSVGEFRQQGSMVTGTFLTNTGDYRFLEGVMDGDSLRLSCFDGGHAFLFTAKVNADQSITGGLYFSGPVARKYWTARRDEQASLPDEFSLTRMKPGQTRLDFSFRNLEGKTVSLSDARFKNKVVVLQIMGSWCPNCMDETAFMSGLYDRYKGRGLEIVGIAYERSTDFDRSVKSLQSFQQRFGVQYPILITGVSVNDSLRSEKTLPQLEKIVGFPTTIFIDRSGQVQKIHTGFNGPGTGIHYEQEKKVFIRTIDALLAP